MKAPWRWAAALLYAAGIFALSSISRVPRLQSEVYGVDKLAHALLYFFFAAVLWRALSNSATRHGVLVAAIIAALYGVTDEIHQHFVPGRTMSFFDWTADAAGAVLWGVYLRYARRRATPRPRRPVP